jgi:hypothetical protein
VPEHRWSPRRGGEAEQEREGGREGGHSNGETAPPLIPTVVVELSPKGTAMAMSSGGLVLSTSPHEEQMR